MSKLPALDYARPGSRRPIRHLRWHIAGLLMLATTLNYLDRQTLAVAVVSKDLDIPDAQYANIQDAWMIAYAVLQPFAGWIIDWLGTRGGMALAVILWSVAEIGHAGASGFRSFASMRFLLGLGESGNYPGAIKAVSEWFPAKERALATGIFNIGSGTGAMIAAPLVAGVIMMWGWQAAFVVTGSLGFLWVIGWLLLYRHPEAHPRLSAGELEYIKAGQEPEFDRPEPVSAIEILAHKEAWAVMLGKFFSDPVWYFYLFWLPKYLKTEHGFDLKDIALFAWMPYVFADVGCVLGGAFSTALAHRGLPILKSRKIAMCVCALLMPAAIPAARVQSAYVALFFICIATFGHQCWSASLLTLPADLFPRRVVGKAYGLAGMCGIFGGALFTYFVGHTVNVIGYVAIFTIVGVLHPVATLMVLLLVGRRPPAFPGRSGLQVV
jgi:ACS family hexuronate transporter-like MFS transporter